MSHSGRRAAQRGTERDTIRRRRRRNGLNEAGKEGIADLASKVRPWLIGSVVLLIVTGILLGLAEAIKVYYSTSFWVKMWGLLIAVVYTFAFRERIIRDEALDTSRRSRLVATGSIGIWFVVAAAGRWIGFS